MDSVSDIDNTVRKGDIYLYLGLASGVAQTYEEF